MGLLRGWLYCFLWYSSILAGYAGLFCPLFPLVFLSNKLYRYCTDALFTFWQFYPTVLSEKLCRCDIQVTGDAIETSETCLVVMNHRTRTDWNFLWPTVYHCIRGKNFFRYPTKFVLKDIIRHIPGPGWVMQMAGFIFIKRCWYLDREIFLKVLEYFSSFPYKFCMVLFPEGTDLTESTKISSDLYAVKNDLQSYDYVLHPRTTGFAFLAKTMLDKQMLDAVYDVTLVYPDVVPQNEAVFLKGSFPRQVKIHLVRYSASVLPKTEQGLGEFLQQRWSDKEKTLREYHSTGHFLHGKVLKNRNSYALLFALYFWSFLPLFVLYCFCFVRWFRILVAVHTCILIGMNISVEGFHNFEIALWKWKTKIR